MAATVTVQLKHPVKWGDTEVVESLELKRTARAMKGFVLPMKGDGTINFEPYACAQVGIRMAGRPDALLDMLDPEDAMELSNVVMGFFVPGRATGSTPSP